MSTLGEIRDYLLPALYDLCTTHSVHADFVLNYFDYTISVIAIRLEDLGKSQVQSCQRTMPESWLRGDEYKQQWLPMMMSLIAEVKGEASA